MILRVGQAWRSLAGQARRISELLVQRLSRTGANAFDGVMTSAPYLGPEPTIEQLRMQFGWMWACCGIHCSHHAALPLGWIARRLGGDASASALRRRLRCSQCGRRTAVLSAPSVVDHGLAPLPLDKVPETLRREIARDALTAIGVKFADR